MAMHAIMDDEGERTFTKRLTMEEIFDNLLSCSERDTHLEDTIHVYDPRELQCGWRSTSCNAKYMACPERPEVGPRQTPSVKNDLSVSTKQKRQANKEKKNNNKDPNQKDVSVRFNKYENLGVFSYGVPSWRTIVDPKTYTYLKRSHPCQLNEACTKTSERSHGIRFLDPGMALDLHLAGLVKRQNACKAMQSSVDGNIRSAIGTDQLWGNSGSQQLQLPQRVRPFLDERIIQPLPRKNVLQLVDIPAAPKLKANFAPPIHIKHQKTGTCIHNSSLPAGKRELSPLVTANRVVGLESSPPGKTRKDVKQHSPQLIRHFSLFNNPFKTPVRLEIMKPTKYSPRDQKLNWLPITSTTLRVPRDGCISVYQSDNPDLRWSKMSGLSHNRIRQAFTPTTIANYH